MYPPGSEDGGFRSEGSSDSKSSLEDPSQIQKSTTIQDNTQNQNQAQPNERNNDGHHVFAHALGPALAALRKKRKKFSASRSSTSVITSGNTSTVESISALPIGTFATTAVTTVARTKSQLYRASSVPAQGPDLTTNQMIQARRHEITQSQQPSLDTVESACVSERLGKF